MTARRIGWIIAIIVLVALMGAPLYLLVTNAFKTEGDIVSAPFSWPTEGFTLDVGSIVLLGILLCVLLALILDTTIVLTGRRLTTWQRAVS